MHYSSVVLGGTFDRLHKGHQQLLTKAFAVGKFVTIGLTTDAYVQRDKESKRQRDRGTIASYVIRKQELERWLDARGWGDRYAIVPIDDAYGPTVWRSQRLEVRGQKSGVRSQRSEVGGQRKQVEEDFQAIVVSPQTRKTAEAINEIRKQKHFAALTIVEIPMIPAQDLQDISSTRIRRGDIDQTGRLTLPDALRPELKKTFGEIISQDQVADVVARDRNQVVITVGDMTTKRILDLGITPALSIIDFQMDRKPFLWDTQSYHQLTDAKTVFSLQSGPGYISKEALDATAGWSGTPTVFLIDGEEDLLVLPVIVRAPLGSIVYYGQPALLRKALLAGQSAWLRKALLAGQSAWLRKALLAGQSALLRKALLAGQPHKGLVRVEITNEKKRRASELLTTFIPS